MTTSKLPVETVLDLERRSVLLLDRLIEKHLFICNEGRTIGRSIGVYTEIADELRQIAILTEQVVRKAQEGKA